MSTFDLSRRFARIRVLGANRADFVQRMSTGDVLGMRPGDCRSTVFTTPIGRMVDHAVVVAEPDSLLLLSGWGNQGKLLGWLRKYVFFNDDVRFEDVTAATSLAATFGPARATVPHAGLDIPAPAQLGEGRFMVAYAPNWVPEGAADGDAFEALRVEAGYPMVPQEIGEEHLPLEAGLWGAVSFKKGCYIGQEIIARLESRGKLAYRLMCLRVEGPAAQPAPGDIVFVDGTAAGKLTSVSPRRDGSAVAAMAYIRAAAATSDRLVELGPQGAAAVIGRACGDVPGLV